MINRKQINTLSAYIMKKNQYTLYNQTTKNIYI